MLDQVIISGLSGALIIVYFFGLGIIFRIFRDHRDKGLSWKESFKSNVKGVRSWIFFSFAALVTSVIVLGIGTSILDSIGLI